MTNYPEILKSLGIRTLIALPFLLVGWLGLLSALSPFAIVAGAIIIATPLARLAAEWTGGLFYPAMWRTRPLPMYSIPQARRTQGAYEEAIRLYQEIAAGYPDEVEPYIQMIDIAIRNLRDPARANAFFLQGIAALGKEADQAVLSAMYSSIRTCLPERES